MKKILFMPKSIEEVKLSNDLVDGYILGIKNLSVNMPGYFTIEEIKNLKTNKEIFISLNKNMYNKDLEYLKEVLLNIDKLNIKGILYYDISLVNLKSKLNLKTDLVWSQEHLTTNYLTCNYWYEKGVKYVMLSNEITKEEIKEIINKSKLVPLIQVFGYFPIFTSKRKVITNYKETFNIKDNSDIYYLEKENNTYPVVEDTDTTIYSNNILDGLDEYLEFDAYSVINSFNIDLEKIIETLKVFKNTNMNNIKENNKLLNNMYNNLDKGFLYKETVYKVKK